MATQMAELAESIAEEPGLIWKIWTENAQDSTAGGIYLFSDEASARAYLQKQQQRLKGFGIPAVTALVFAVNTALSQANHAPLPA